MEKVAAVAFFVMVAVAAVPAHAAPPCLSEDNSELCMLADATLADNPTFAELQRASPDDERARASRHQERRQDVRNLLNTLAAPTWRDLYRAGYVIAYGSTPEEDLLAHAISVRALSLAPEEMDVRFLVAMTLDELGRRYVGYQLYGRQKYFHFAPSGAVDTACLPEMLDPPLPQSIGPAFHTPADGFERCPPGVGALQR
ncbi:MAG: hypothetical protein JNM59_08810 [Hyphomonadaceae bacterium]|nr:hypothetical protein [Hyphomonadaceae bacterium]